MKSSEVFYDLISDTILILFNNIVKIESVDDFRNNEFLVTHVFNTTE